MRQTNFPSIGRWTAPLALILAAGCGGAILGGRSTHYKATLESGAATDKVTLIVTRNNAAPGTNSDDCRLDQTLPDWCEANDNSLSFTVQPSYTLYRVYVLNLSPTAPATATVRLQDDANSTTATIAASKTRWFWELGTDTVNEKTN
ncbi:hypothetical protein BH11ARM2_BH11ARM2_35400 [soil metagenome]